MKRLKIAFFVSIFAFCGINPVYSAVKTGTSCSKIRATVTVAGFRYTCVKNGKKLIWSKGVSVNPSKPASQVPENGKVTPSAESSAAESPYIALKKKAYNNIRNAASSGNTENVSIVYHIGDTFPVDLKELYSKQVEYVSQLYSSFFNKKEIINIYMYTEKDSDLIKENSNLNFNFSDFEPWFSNWKNGNMREHNIGLASYYLLRNAPPQGHAGLAVYSGSNSKSIRPYGIQVMPHEYWHVVQDYYMQIGRDKKFSDEDSYDLFFPPTFREGSTNTISFALALNNFDDYLSLYKSFVQSKKTDSGMKIFGTLKTNQDVVRALESIEVRSKNPEAHEASYLMGQLLYEWVIGEYGFEGYRKIIVNQLIGNSFEDNLKASLGLTKADLYRNAAGHILAAFNS